MSVGRKPLTLKSSTPDGDRTVIVGAGPAGLSAAYELARLGRPAIVLEKDDTVGGLSRTVSSGGYRFDIGGHRFFTKAPEIRAVWHDLLGDELLVRPRMSRIFYNGRFFSYPLRPMDALVKIGPIESTRIIASYVRARVFPKADERSFEDWVVNRFGRRLFEIFFKSYTEKVWGIACSEISSDWAAQRIRDLDLSAAIRNALFGHGAARGEVVTTLIERFEYPRLGPGMMWERCRDRVAEVGIQTLTGREVTGIHHQDDRVRAVTVRRAGAEETISASHVISTMPLPHLIRALDPPPTEEVLEAAAKLRYRDFLTVVLVVDREQVFPDNWIYIHDPTVYVGRVQNFKNWSPEMVPDPDTSALGLEYFVQESDELWSRSDRELRDLAVRELAQLGLIEPREVIDHAVVRVHKAYPVYDGQFRDSVEVIRGYLSRFSNLWTVGRNGQHRYNNQDHSMLAGIQAARNVAGKQHDVWSVNVEPAYHEGEATDAAQRGDRRVPSRLNERPFEEILESVFARYDPLALGGSVAAVAGAAVFFATAVPLVFGAESMGPALSLLGQYLFGYEVSWPGVLVGVAEAAIGGFGFGWLLARLINVLVGHAERSAIRECQLARTLDPLDSGEGREASR